MINFNFYWNHIHYCWKCLYSKIKNVQKKKESFISQVTKIKAKTSQQSRFRELKTNPTSHQSSANILFLRPTHVVLQLMCLRMKTTSSSAVWLPTRRSCSCNLATCQRKANNKRLVGTRKTSRSSRSNGNKSRWRFSQYEKLSCVLEPGFIRKAKINQSNSIFTKFSKIKIFNGHSWCYLLTKLTILIRLNEHCREARISCQ